MSSFLPFFLPELTRTARAALVAAVLASVPVLQAQAAGLSGQGTWETTLHGRDLDGDASTFEAYYDTALDITWLADANYAETSKYLAANGWGEMTWDEASTWVAQLNIKGITGWRLPTLLDTGAPGCNFGYGGTDCGYNVSTSTSELAHMYYVTLGNKSDHDSAGNYQPGYGLKNRGPFNNFQPSTYWFGVEYTPATSGAWEFYASNGRQLFNYKGVEYAAWAVRDGDVAAVPEPQGYALALVSLAVAGAAIRRRR